MSRVNTFNCDSGDRLADLLDLSDEWLSFDDLCRLACDEIEKLRTLESEMERKACHDEYKSKDYLY